ncbi:AAA family ATPase [Nonomuraea helvata]|uniref:AAA family ATPase n=1 Tax=Nonomuraea helvata TaxID=37484 RepID=A0ABV5S9C9_9ACTN
MNDLDGGAGDDRLSDGSQDASTRSVVMMCGIAGSGKSTYAQALGAGQAVVLDYSFWRRTTRDYYKALVESHGCRWELVYLKASPETLRRRLAVRNKLHGANSVTVSEDLLDRYLAGFEEPVDEGELMILQD